MIEFFKGMLSSKKPIEGKSCLVRYLAFKFTGDDLQEIHYAIAQYIVKLIELLNRDHTDFSTSSNLWSRTLRISIMYVHSLDMNKFKGEIEVHHRYTPHKHRSMSNIVRETTQTRQLTKEPHIKDLRIEDNIRHVFRFVLWTN